MTSDERMPAPGHPGVNAVVNTAIGVVVACGLQASRWGLAYAHRKQIRDNDRAARRASARERRMAAWDEFGCDVWSWDD